MNLKYRTGEEIKPGDHVRYGGNLATIELVATPPGDQETDWYVREYGSGVMIVEPTVFGHLFISADQIDEDEDLEFVSRAES